MLAVIDEWPCRFKRKEIGAPSMTAKSAAARRVLGSNRDAAGSWLLYAGLPNSGLASSRSPRSPRDQGLIKVKTAESADISRQSKETELPKRL